jgi:dTDP-4-dehydrorhamnose reductase
MKILLLGKEGQIGWELQRSLALLGEVVSINRESQCCGDLTDLDGIARTVREIAPDVIVNAAAYTAVDEEAEEQRTTRHRKDFKRVEATFAFLRYELVRRLRK